MLPHLDALPSFPRTSTISSSSRFVVEGVFRESGVVHFSRWLIQFCLCLDFTSCIPEITVYLLVQIFQLALNISSCKENIN